MRIKTFEAFTQENEQVEWLVEGLIPDTGWFLFVGEQGVGKSTFVAQMCQALATGALFLGMKCLKIRPLFVQADSPTKEWREVIRRVAPRSQALTMVDVPRGCLDNTELVERMKEWFTKIQPGFIVFDSLYNMSDVPEGTKQILKPISVMKELCIDKPFLVIAHPSKEGLSRGVQGHSGHNSLSANCSIHFTLMKNRLRTEKGRLIDKKTWSFVRDAKGLWCLEPEILSDEDQQERRWLKAVI